MRDAVIPSSYFRWKHIAARLTACLLLIPALYMTLEDLRSLVASRGGALGRTPVILISTSGERSARAADYLHKAGVREVYTVVYGFTGGQHPEDQAQSWQGVGLPYNDKTARASLR
jgi:rhodanese-related sulfurtransferase